jgi:hypothetical protein
LFFLKSLSFIGPDRDMSKDIQGGGSAKAMYGGQGLFLQQFMNLADALGFN